MYFKRLLSFVLFIVFFCGINSRLQSEPFQPLPETQGQLFSKEIEAKLQKLDVEYRLAIWPNAEELEEKQPLDSILPDVIQDSANYMRVILKSGWIPEDLEDHFVAFRRITPSLTPQQAEIFIVRYEIKGQRIQISEDGYGISILIDPMAEKDSQSSISEYMITCAKEYLNLPEERIANIKTELKTVELDGSETLHFGKVYCEDKNMDPERKWWEQRTWWHWIYVWSDGRLIYFSTVRKYTRPVLIPNCKPGLQPRF